MTTIISLFIISLVSSLILTPLMKSIGKKYSLVDKPGGRKIHTKPIPITGGIAIYLSFFIPLLSSLFVSTVPLKLITLSTPIVAILIGSTLVFLLGLIDDIKGIKAGYKLIIQIIAALIAYYGGIKIEKIGLAWDININLGLFSLPVTIIWFLLVVNAINLIDGLDGLAAGVTFFASLILLVLSITSNRILVSVGFASLAGASLGFLRYNFNPASIFMGDSGSYFLGYMLASMSILGSIKSQATVAILIPIISLGLPLMDTITSPIRRFFLGQNPFKADKDHFHHRLLRLGLTQKKAVLILYGITVGMGIVSFIVVHAKDETAALVLLLLGLSSIIGIRKLGYLEYLATDKLFGWLHDISEDFGIKRARRTFLGWQMAIAEATSAEQLWKVLISTAKFLGLDFMEVSIWKNELNDKEPKRYIWHSENKRGFDEIKDLSKFDFQNILFISVPLKNSSSYYGIMKVAKETLSSPIDPQTLRRIEHFRRSIEEMLYLFYKEEQ